jgi:hypothetical protein
MLLIARYRHQGGQKDGRHLYGLFLGFLLMTCTIALPSAPFAEAAGAITTCNSLTAQETANENYRFSVSAAPGSSETIMGYVFNFGDNQSYEFDYDPVTGINRGQAKIDHIYSNPGTYVVTASVVTAANGKTKTTSSRACTIDVAVGQANSKLPGSGPGNTLVLFVGISTIGTVMHYVLMSRRPHQLG